MVSNFNLLFLILSLSAAVISSQVTDRQWNSFKAHFNKSYRSRQAEKKARLIFTKNVHAIELHNVKYNRSEVSYKLAPNQFTDLTFETVRKMFPLVKCEDCFKKNSNDAYILEDSYDYAKDGYESKVQDQGLQCSSGWAYALAAAAEIIRAKNVSGNRIKAISAQYFLDCIGGHNVCKGQDLLSVIAYLTAYRIPIFEESDYKNTPQFGKGYCSPPLLASNVYKFHRFASLFDADRKSLVKAVKNVAPVLFEFNQLSFEFMHYKEGIFTPPNDTVTGSHYMTIVGYSKDFNGYWKLQNSFGTNWGENGYIRLANDPWKPINRMAVYPTRVSNYEET